MDLTAEQETAPSMAERAPRRGIGYALLAATLFGVNMNRPGISGGSVS